MPELELIAAQPQPSRYRGDWKESIPVAGMGFFAYNFMTDRKKGTMWNLRQGFEDGTGRGYFPLIGHMIQYHFDIFLTTFYFLQ